MIAGEGRDRSRNREKSVNIFSDYFLPVESLRPFISTFYLLRCEDERIRDIHPANLANLIFTAQGSGYVLFPGGVRDPIAPVSLYTPCSRAAQFEAHGPFHAISAVLTPLGWAAFAGLDAGIHGNRLYDAAEWITPEFNALAAEWRVGYRSGRLSPAEIINRFGLEIERQLKPVNPRHAQFIEDAISWLGGPAPDVAPLMRETGYSARQVQRLTERYLGLPPRALWRKSRAIRAAAVLSNPKASAAAIAAVMNYFYDQPHMIREIRLFLGRTPSQLQQARSPILNQWLQMRNLRRIAPWGRHPDAD